MAEEMLIAEAKKVFDGLCAALDANKWKYQKDEAELVISCGAQGEDLPIELVVRVDAKRRLVILLSKLPFVVAEDKRMDACVAVSAVNSRLVDGSFDYNVLNGKMFFRMTNSYIDSALSESVYMYMIYCACHTIDEYNDQFLMLSKGMLSLEQFLTKATN